MKKGLCGILACMLLLSSCSTMVAIRTEPDGAKIKLNSQPLGVSPVETDMSNFDFQDYVVEISKSGYKTLTATLQKEFKVGAFVVGLLVWWPELLWAYGPKSVQTFELEPAN